MDSQTEKTQPKFGTFIGVYTPSVLTILGAIMYLRLGWVVAHAGLAGTLLIVVICSATAFITGLSASAVATNMPLGAGGEYYLISRSLGLTIGGAIGIPLFLCRTLSVTLYCYALAEAVMIFWPQALGEPNIQWLAGGLVLLTTLVAGKSANVALKAQIPLMVVVALSIAALAVGVFTGPIQSPHWPAFEDRMTSAGGFWAVLAIFFPAVTGFTAGIGLSGDLKDPQKSIPRGTIMALVTGTLVYLFVPVLLAITGKVTFDTMADISTNNDPIWTHIAIFGGLLIFPGMWAAILSSAFGSALAGPRVLQALAMDGLMPSFIGRTSKTGQPVVASAIGGTIALLAVLLGGLNNVATVVTIFFLTLYMSINIVAAVESIVRDPSYRPTIKVPWFISLLGVIASLVVMFLISPIGCVLAIGLQLVLWLLLRRRDLRTSWGNIWVGLWGTLARLAIHKLTVETDDPRSWRPNILLFADRIEQRASLVKMAGRFSQNNGILTVCDVVCDTDIDAQTIRQRQKSMAEFFARERMLAFGEVDVVEEFGSGVTNIVQAGGIGGLRPNTIIFGWPRRQERLVGQLAVLRTLEKLEKAALLIRPNPAGGPQRYKRIDVWWRGKQNNGDLMLLLAHLLKMNPLWRHAEITVRSIVTNKESLHDTQQNLKYLTDSVRIQAKQDVIVKPTDKTVMDIMHETSGSADVVFLGLVTPQQGEEEKYAKRLIDLVDGLGTTVLVRNNGPFKGKLL